MASRMSCNYSVRKGLRGEWAASSLWFFDPRGRRWEKEIQGAEIYVHISSGRRGRHDPVVADEEESELGGRGRGCPPTEGEEVVHPELEFKDGERARLP